MTTVKVNNQVNAEQDGGKLQKENESDVNCT